MWRFCVRSGDAQIRITIPSTPSPDTGGGVAFVRFYLCDAPHVTEPIVVTAVINLHDRPASTTRMLGRVRQVAGGSSTRHGRARAARPAPSFRGDRDPIRGRRKVRVGMEKGALHMT